MHAVGEHLPHKASGALRRRHLLIPAGFQFLLWLPGSPRLRATPGPRAVRRPGSRRPQLRLPGMRLSWRARGLRAPQAAPVGLPRAPSLPRRRARSSARLLDLSAARWGRRELAAQRRAGGVPRRRGHGAGAGPAVSAPGRGRWRPWAALELLGARRWRRLWAQKAEAGRAGKGREGKGGERGKGKRGEGLPAGGGARADGEGLQSCEAWKGYSAQHPNSR